MDKRSIIPFWKLVLIAFASLCVFALAVSMSNDQPQAAAWGRIVESVVSE